MSRISIYEYISIMFSAPFIALYIILRVFFDNHISLIELVLGLISLTILPIIIPVYYAYRIGVEWDYPERAHRFKPFLIIVFIYGLFLVYSLLISGSRVLSLIAGSYFANGLVSWLITLQYKISIHMVGIYGPATIMLSLGYTIDSVILYAIGVLTGFARYKMNRHNLYQLVLGGATGIVVTLLIYYLVIGID